MNNEVSSRLEQIYRAEYGRILAALMRSSRDLESAEEAVHEAFAEALSSWPTQGLPEHPGAWLMTAARRRRIDRLRKSARDRRQKVSLDAADTEVARDSNMDGGDAPDERLRLAFLCCHPALSIESRIALTLNALLGLKPVEVGRALLTTEDAAARRLLRAKAKVREAGMSYDEPGAHTDEEKVEAVHAVIYLLFNAGYSGAPGEDLLRAELCDTAIDLSRELVARRPADSESRGLVALLLFQHSRRLARVNANGDLIRLEFQDRSLWKKDEVAEATRYLRSAARIGRTGSYQIQAAIAACHAHASTADEVPWRVILGLYDRLLDIEASPIVELNRAVAVAMVHGSEAALRIADDLVDAHPLLDGYTYFHAARARFLENLGRDAEAETARHRAAALTSNESERRFLLGR